jgi:hypothetical protein
VGWPNIIKDEGSIVKGVLYNLPKRIFDVYANKTDSSYEVRSVEVTVDGEGNKPVRAHTFVASETKDDLPLSMEQLRLMMQGAKNHELADDYLRKFETGMKGVTPSGTKE